MLSVGSKKFSFDVIGYNNRRLASFTDLKEASQFATAFNLRTKDCCYVVRVDYEVIADYNAFPNDSFVKHLNIIKHASKRF